MPMLPPQAVQVACPNCRTPYQVPVFQMLDVGQMPDLKMALLSGRINVAVCPNCGTGGRLASPLIYHDPAKQFFFALFPPEIKATPQEQEQFIGAMSQMVIKDLPADAPKGYLLNPRRFITLNSMLDTILEGEGISKEQLEAQRRRSELLSRLLQAGDDAAALEKLVNENRAQLDYEFFLTLSAYIDAAEQEGDQESRQHFAALRDQLVALTGFTAPAEQGTDEPEPDVEAAVDALLGADDEQLPALIAEHRPALDYDFFEQVTARADAARSAGDTAEAERIEARRTKVLETAEQMDRDAQAMFEGAAETLQEVLQAPDLRAALVERREQLNEAFLLVVGANVEAAERAGKSEVVDRLHEIERLAVEVVQESLSPEDRLIGQLLNAETPQAATKLMRQNAGQITTDLVKRINALTTEMEESGRKEIADRLRQLSREATSMLF